MPLKTGTAGTLEKLREILTQLPLDAEQRDTVSINLASLNEERAASLLKGLTGTLERLSQTVREVQKMMALSSTQSGRGAERPEPRVSDFPASLASLALELQMAAGVSFTMDPMQAEDSGRWLSESD